MMRPHSPSPGHVAAREFGDQEGGGAGVDAEHLVDRVRVHRRLRQSEAVRGGGDEAVGDPARGVVHQNGHRPQLGLGRLEESGDARGVGQVRFHGALARPPAARIDWATLSARAMRVAR